jgi:hypothetical protein
LRRKAAFPGASTVGCLPTFKPERALNDTTTLHGTTGRGGGGGKEKWITTLTTNKVYEGFVMKDTKVRNRHKH